MFNRRLLFNGAGGNVVNHDFGLLVGTFDDVMIGIYHRGGILTAELQKAVSHQPNILGIRLLAAICNCNLTR